MTQTDAAQIQDRKDGTSKSNVVITGDGFVEEFNFSDRIVKLSTTEYTTTRNLIIGDYFTIGERIGREAENRWFDCVRHQCHYNGSFIEIRVRSPFINQN